MEWDYQGRFADGSLSYLLNVEKSPDGYSVVITAEGSRRWGKIQAHAREFKNTLVVYFDSYIHNSDDFSWSFKPNELLFSLKKVKGKVITTWHSLKLELPEPVDLPPGNYFIRER